MNYGTVKSVDIANGDGVRVSLFVSGCTHHCPGCFNPETWDFGYGVPFDRGAEERIMRLLDRSYINGLSLLGGEPFEPENQRALLPLVRRVRAELPKKDIWAYTGYIYDRDLLPGGRAYCEATDELLDALAVLVDGPFIESRKDISLKFRGSDNQRLIDMAATRRGGTGDVAAVPLQREGGAASDVQPSVFMEQCDRFSAETQVAYAAASGSGAVPADSACHCIDLMDADHIFDQQ